MINALLPFFAFFLLFLLYLLFLTIYDSFYRLEDIADKQVYASTKDGWSIAMHWHEPDSPKKSGYPVILSHGIATNKYSLDLCRPLSLAYFLKQEGYSVFVLSLRGAGNSYHNSRCRTVDFSFDDIVEYDVPAVIQKAREVTGAPKVHWVGHSMGAMIAQAFLGRRLSGHEDIASFVSLGGLGRLDHVRHQWWSAFSRYPRLSSFFSLRLGARLAAPFIGQVYTPLHKTVYNRENLHKKTVKYLLRNAVEDIAEGLSLQFSHWIHSGEEKTSDASFDYRKALENIHLPALFIAGLDDKIAAPECVRFAWEKSSSPKKRFVLLSKENNFSRDYCHMGLLVGKEAPREVFPLVSGWLEQYGCEKRLCFDR